MNRRSLLVAGGGALLHAARRGAAQEPSAPREPLAGAWVRAVPGVTALAVSPEGGRVLIATRNGSVRSYDNRDGLLLWETEEPGAERVVLARKGAVALVYSPRDPFALRARFFGAGGRRLGSVEAPGPIELAALAPDGSAAALVADGRLVLISLADGRVRGRAFALPAAAAHLQMGPGGGAYVAVRDPDAVEFIGADGRRLWRRADGRLPSISAAADGRTVAIAVEQGQDSVETLLVSAGNQARGLDTRSGRRPLVRVAAGGTAAMLTYEHRLEHQGQVRWRRRLAYLGAGAGGGWPKGGSHSAPLFVAIEREGEWVVALDTQDRGQLPRFRLYGRGGERRWFYPSAAPVLLAASCAEGRAVAVYRADGFLELLRVNLPAPGPAQPAAGTG